VLRERIAENGRRLHAERFAIAHTVTALRAEPAPLGATT
jgi:hypothetical protein